MVLVQGWSSFSPFSAVDFVSLYIEIPVMIVMYVAWMLIKRPDPNHMSSLASTSSRRKWYTSDLVDVNTVDLFRDEYEEALIDEVVNADREKRSQGKARWLWRVYYWLV